MPAAIVGADVAGRVVPRVVGALAALVLLLDIFVIYGAGRLDPIDPAEALVDYLSQDTFDGLPGWDQPLTGARPVAGVYIYATEGGSTIDRLGIDRRYPDRTTRIITHGPGCQWRETVPLFSEHRETYSACALRGDQLDTGFGTRLVYFFVPASTSTVCEPAGTRTGAGMTVGQSRGFSCRDDDNDVDVAGTVTYDGIGSADVGGVAVSCRRVRVVTVLTGSNRGSAVRSLCTTPDTGVVLTETRSVGVVVRSGLIGTVSYVEEATFVLTSLTPLV